MGALITLANTALSFVESSNNRDIYIAHDNNQTKIELSKIALGGVALLGTIALQLYNAQKNSSTNKH